MIYFFVIIPVLFFSYFYRSKYSFLLFLLSIIIITIFAAGRNEIGNDWSEYARYYDQISGCGDLNCALLATRLEPGFVTAAYTASAYLNSYQDFLFIAAVFSILGFFKSSYPYGAPLLLILIGYLRFEYLQTNFMFVRQGVSLVFFIYSIRFIKEEKMMKFLLMNGIGSFFHILSFALLPAYFLVRKNFGYFTHYIFLVTATLLMLLNIDLLRFFANFLPYEPIGLVIRSYLESDVWGASAGFSFSSLEKITILFIGIAMRKKLSLMYQYYDIFLKLHFLCVIIWLSTFTAYVFNERMSVFMNVGQIFLLAFFIDSIKAPILKFLAISILLLWNILFFYKTLYLAVGSDVYHPYSNFVLGF